MRDRGEAPRDTEDDWAILREFVGEAAWTRFKQEPEERYVLSLVLSGDVANKLVPSDAFSDEVRVYTEEQRQRTIGEDRWTKWKQQLEALRELAKLQEAGAITTEEATRRAAAVISNKIIKDQND